MPAAKKTPAARAALASAKLIRQGYTPAEAAKNLRASAMFHASNNNPEMAKALRTVAHSL